MLRIKEAIVVEGRYDKNALSQVVDTLILETGGFHIFKDPEQLALLRQASAPLVLIVVNNNGGQIFSMLPTPQDERRQVYLMPQDVDFSHAAAMFGLAYHRPDDWPSLDEALAGAWRRAGATVIELAVNETDGAQTLQQLLAQVSRL